MDPFKRSQLKLSKKLGASHDYLMVIEGLILVPLLHPPLINLF